MTWRRNMKRVRASRERQRVLDFHNKVRWSGKAVSVTFVPTLAQWGRVVKQHWSSYSQTTNEQLKHIGTQIRAFWNGGRDVGSTPTARV